MNSKAPPHPSPPETSDRPEGEGTDWGIFTKYTDLKLLYRIHNRLDLSGRRTAPDTSVGSLSLGERAGVRGQVRIKRRAPDTPHWATSPTPDARSPDRSPDTAYSAP
ncbi:hypothetical protein C1891_27170 [Pseudomonas sp. GW456-12-1-14-TSB6]|nr:hypothetical protein C1891_27170 [Pseudomonas sp. GW456-12-1-14-TSB6]